MTETQNDELKFKLIVVGDINTGKSSILNRFTKNVFEEHYQSTIGLDFISKNYTIHNQEVRLVLYDTAGQEKFRSLIPMYIREAQIILLIYDISNKNSFDSIPKWFSDILNVKDDEAVFGLIGNKNDLNDKREVTYEEGKKLADEKNIIFEEISAKTGNNINEFFHDKVFEALYNKFRNKFKNDNENNINYNLENTESYTIPESNIHIDDNKDINTKKKKKKCC